MRFNEFKKNLKISLDDICLDIIRDENNTINVKNEKIGVKKLRLILETAISLSSKKGFHAMSLRELCSECNLSMGGLYGYINSKDELLTVIQDHGRRMVLRVMDDYMDREKSPLEQLSDAVYIHLYLSEILHAWFFFSFMETRFFSKNEQERSIETELLTEKIFSDILDAGCLKGDFEIENPTITASIIKSMLQEWYLKRWKYLRRKISVEKYGETVLSFIENFVTKGDKNG